MDFLRADLSVTYPILFGRHWRASGLAETVAAIDVDVLCAEYAALREAAPRRSRTGKSYFVGHTGFPSTGSSSNRAEEHTAIALRNLDCFWPISHGKSFRFLDYQVPLKASHADAGIGKIDLLGVSDSSRLVIVELKVGRGLGLGDPPLAALMEGLRYASIVEADFEAFSSEALQRFGVEFSADPPMIILLAPQAWWREWIHNPAAGDWSAPFGKLLEAFRARTGVATECIAFDDTPLSYGQANLTPRLETVPSLRLVNYGGIPGVGNALPPPTPAPEAATRYLQSVTQSLWAWADHHHAGQLDDGPRSGRPPVLKSEFAELNVLVAEEGTAADRIRGAIGVSQRHRHFASLRSSQVLAQSVFGAVKVHGRLELLQGLTADCGRPAFFVDHRGWSLALEHEVRTLGEPRPTSIDVLMTGPGHRIAIECKFTEGEFGRCSRPGLSPRDAQYQAQRCNGDYQAQAGRTVRCALTAIGIQYWDHLPNLFDWPSDRDHEPCPFGQTYQLARNALAATTSQDGQSGSTRGHALVVYAANIPAFQPGGAATVQWEKATAACLTPGLLRRVSWQRLLAAIVRDPLLAKVSTELQEKYGLHHE